MEPEANNTSDSPCPLVNETKEEDPGDHSHHHLKKRHPKPKIKHLNELQKGIQYFISAHLPASILSAHNITPETLTASLPKRFTIYEPLLLLPVNALSTPAPWGSLYRSLTPEQRNVLFSCILASFRRPGVTHIAINAPIPMTASDSQGAENRMRSPVGLVPLYGDFGPLPSHSYSSATTPEGDGDSEPSETDLRQAFWVRTVQNHGIEQVWAPLYTMFSRGNITEKARILGHGNSGSVFEGLDEESLGGQRVEDISVVDMYAGIGYFVFSYLKRGVKRVWGWEINGWSVEGLRRGCERNGWGCRVVKVREDGSLSVSVEELVRSLGGNERVVVFHGDNQFAAGILGLVGRVMEADEGVWNAVRHVNLGLLPTSAAAWEDACQMVDVQLGGWLHVHENVDVTKVERKKEEVVMEIGRLRTQALGLHSTSGAAADCRHVEFVKTYAPGVMHCVFDIKLPSYAEAAQRSS